MAQITVTVPDELERELQKINSLEAELEKLHVSVKKRGRDVIKVFVAQREEAMNKAKALEDEINRLREKRERYRAQAVALYWKLRKLGWSTLAN